MNVMWDGVPEHAQLRAIRMNDDGFVRFFHPTYRAIHLNVRTANLLSAFHAPIAKMQAACRGRDLRGPKQRYVVWLAHLGPQGVFDPTPVTDRRLLATKIPPIACGAARTLKAATEDALVELDRLIASGAQAHCGAIDDEGKWWRETAPVVDAVFSEAELDAFPADPGRPMQFAMPDPPRLGHVRVVDGRVQVFTRQGWTRLGTRRDEITEQLDTAISRADVAAETAARLRAIFEELLDGPKPHPQPGQP